MELKSLITNDKIIKVEHPDYDGLVVELKYVPREKLKKFIEKATVTTYDRKAKGTVEELDDELFSSLYVPELIKGWTGFKYKFLSELLPVDLSAVDPEDELEYSVENAIVLLKNSPEFDDWVSSIVKDVKNFNKNS